MKLTTKIAERTATTCARALAPARTLASTWRQFGIAALLIATIGCHQSRAAEYRLPAKSDFTDYGTILEPGSIGDWDFLLFGGFAGAAVKHKGVYYLYYQGSDGYSDALDTVTNRSIGVAMSPDGINFVKSDRNPVVVWQPNGHIEEGAVSAGATLDKKGRVAMFFGANTEESRTTVNSDARLAVSRNARKFRIKRKVLDHNDSRLWASGDEIFPVFAIQSEGRWLLYYIPNGVAEKRVLGVAWGTNPKKLTQSARVEQNGGSVKSWGMAGGALVAPDTLALFTNDVRVRRMEARIVNLKNPSKVTTPVKKYRFPNFSQGTVLLDQETSTWFLYYRNRDQSAYGVMLAPAGTKDNSPPSEPLGVSSETSSSGGIVLSWDPATDTETGIVVYRIYCDDKLIGTTTRWSFRDDSDQAHESFYEVSAVNFHGLEGPKTVAVQHH